jgi:hypothetical protein
MSAKALLISELKDIKLRLDTIHQELSEVSLDVLHNHYEPNNCSDDESARIRDAMPSDAAVTLIEEAMEQIGEEVKELELFKADKGVLKLGSGMKTINLKEED